MNASNHEDDDEDDDEDMTYAPKQSNVPDDPMEGLAHQKAKELIKSLRGKGKGKAALSSNNGAPQCGGPRRKSAKGVPNKEWEGKVGNRKPNFKDCATKKSKGSHKALAGATGWRAGANW